MKNTKLFGRIVCLIMAVVMCLSLAACGSSGQPGTANTKKDQEPTPEYVYTAEYKDLTQNARHQNSSNNFLILMIFAQKQIYNKKQRTSIIRNLHSNHTNWDVFPHWFPAFHSR